MFRFGMLVAYAAVWARKLSSLSTADPLLAAWITDNPPRQHA